MTEIIDKNKDIKDAILKLLNEKKYIKESELYSYLESLFPRRSNVDFQKGLGNLIDDFVNRRMLYDITARHVYFVVLGEKKDEALDEIIKRGYRVRPPAGTGRLR